MTEIKSEPKNKTMTKIKSELKTVTKDYSQELVKDVWLETFAPLPTTDAAADYYEKIDAFLASVPKDGSGTICVFSEELSSHGLCKTLADIRDCGNRIYILTNERHNEMKNLDGCLIRYGGERKHGTFVIIDPNGANPNGRFFTGSLGDGSLRYSTNLLLELDKNQVAVLFRFFCHQFWDKAAKEFLEHKEQDAGKAPFDIYPPKSDSCDIEYLKSIWTKEAKGAVITASLLKENAHLKYVNFSNSTVYSLFSNIDNNLVRSLNKNNNEIFTLDDVSFINSLKADEGTWLMPIISAAAENVTYSLMLNKQQEIIWNEHIEKIISPKALYKYVNQDTRENLCAKTICKLGEGVSSKHQIILETHIEPKIPESFFSKLLSKETFDNLERFEPYLNDDGKSIKIVYKWINKPFTLPASCVEHSLYGDWKKYQEKVDDFIAKIKMTIDENEKKGKSSIEKFPVISQFIAGKKHKFTKHKDELEEIRKIDFSLIDRMEVEKNIKRVNEIWNSIMDDGREIQKEIRISELKEQIKNIEMEKQKSEDGLSNKQNKLNEIEKKITSLNENSPNKSENTTPIHQEPVTDESLKDLHVKKSRLSDDIKDIEDKIKGKESEILHLESEINKLDKLVKDNSTKSDSVLNNVVKNKSKNIAAEPASQNLSVPNLDKLPETGKLYQHPQKKQESYLMIEFWEEYTNGREEAKRLNVTLCAKGE